MKTHPGACSSPQDQVECCQLGTPAGYGSWASTARTSAAAQTVRAAAAWLRSGLSAACNWRRAGKVSHEGGTTFELKLGTCKIVHMW